MAGITEKISNAQTYLEDGEITSAFEELKGALALALVANDYTNAAKVAESLQGLIATFGNTEQQSGQNRTKIEWDGEPLQNIIRRARIRAASAGGIKTQPYQYGTTSAYDD